MIGYKNEKELIKNFICIREKLLNLGERYSLSFEALYEEVKKNAVRYEYAKGGKTIHRGYYSPSSTDLVVGGCSRGRLLKNKPEVFDYEYIFDKEDKLICYRCYGEFLKSYDVEILFYEGDVVSSVVYRPRGEQKDYRIVKVTECRYEQKRPVEFYELYGLYGKFDKVGSLWFEKVSYSKFGIESLDFGDVLFERNSIVVHEKYNFNRDSDGLLTSYVPVDIYTGIPSEKAVYPISKKNRKR